MRLGLICCLWGLAASLYSAYGQRTFVNTLMPEPQVLQVGAGNGLLITAHLTIAADAPPSDSLRATMQRMRARLQDQTGVRLDDGSPTAKNATILFHVANVAETQPRLGEDESYSIDVNSTQAIVNAKTLFGAYDAMETLLQLVQADRSGFFIPPIHIEDEPRFPWRGLLLDPGRRFLPVAAILRTLDGMAAVKLNVLHLHLSENQGFRMESKSFPKLQEQGSEGFFYSQAEMRQIIAYAAARGIRIVPEFDIPGHSTSWLVGYPFLASAAGPYHVEHEFGIFDAAIDPTRESTYEFLDRFFGEMAKVFPDEYVHIGGDESNGKQWQANPEIRQFMKLHGLSDTKALQAYFNKRVQGILRKYGKKMVGWDEVLHPDLDPDVVVQDWHGVEFLTNSARQGHNGLLSQPYYLDHTYSAAQMYLADPIPQGANLTAEEAKRILGGEACMWGEMAGPETIDSRIWPRSAAVAERLWSSQQLRDVDDMYRRLQVESLRLDALGLQHLSGPQRLLRQMSGKVETPALDTVIATLEPVDFSERRRREHPTQDSSLSNLVDAAVPDPPLKYSFSRLVDVYLHSPDEQTHARSLDQLRRLFQSWIESGSSVTEFAASHPRLQPGDGRYAQLSELGHIGQYALNAYEKKSTGKETQKNEALTLQSLKSQPDESLTKFVILDPLLVLVNASN